MPSVAEWWKNETFIPLDWSPPTPPAATRHGGRGRWLLALVALPLMAVSAGLGWLAWAEHRTAQRAQAVVRIQAAQLGTLRSELAAGDLLLSSSTTVAGELQACIEATSKAASDFFGFLRGSEDKAASVCSTAEADYQQLLSSTGSAR